MSKVKVAPPVFFRSSSRELSQWSTTKQQRTSPFSDPRRNSRHTDSADEVQNGWHASLSRLISVRLLARVGSVVRPVLESFLRRSNILNPSSNAFSMPSGISIANHWSKGGSGSTHARTWLDPWQAEDKTSISFDGLNLSTLLSLSVVSRIFSATKSVSGIHGFWLQSGLTSPITSELAPPQVPPEHAPHHHHHRVQHLLASQVVMEVVQIVTITLWVVRWQSCRVDHKNFFHLSASSNSSSDGAKRPCA